MNIVEIIEKKYGYKLSPEELQSKIGYIIVQQELEIERLKEEKKKKKRR